MSASGGYGPFIGRAGELDRLERVLDATLSRRAGVVVVGGESGVGKTRLVGEFVDRARGRGVEVLIGGCVDLGDNGPSYWPLREALRPLWDGAGVAGDHPGQSPMFEQALQVLRGRAETTPVLLVIEDVHWADRSTGDLLTFFLANLTQDRVMVIVTYRREALGGRHSWQPLLAELRRNRRAEFMELLPFTRPELVQQIHGLLGRPPDDELVELTWSRSDGNAFFVEELVAAVVEGLGNELPPTLRHILLGRVDGLSDAAQRVLRLVAVAGDGVTSPLLSAVSDLPEADLLAATRECVEHQLLIVAAEGQTYRLRHSLMQEVLYRELLPGERHLFHRAYGEALSHPVGRGDIAGSAQLAYHWYAAGDAERALRAALDAASASAAVYGFAEAQRHYERALGLWDRVADPVALVGSERGELLARTAEVAHLAGEHQRAAALIGAALSADPAVVSAAPAVGDTRQAVRYQRLGRYLWAAGDSREALVAYEKAVHCLPPGVASIERAAVEGAFAEALMLSGRYHASREHAEAALPIAQQAGALLEEAQIQATLGFDLAFLGDSALGLLALERAQLIAEELGNPDDIGRACLLRATLLSGPLNHLAEAADVAARGAVRVGQLGLARTYGVALQAIAINTLFRLGRWPEADALWDAALAAKPTGTAAIDLFLARAKLSVGRGDFECAEADFLAVEALATGGLGPRYQMPLLTLRAGRDLWLGRAEQVRASVGRGVAASRAASDDFWLLAPLLWHGLRAEADLADRARGQRDAAALRQCVSLAAALLAHVEQLADRSQTAAPSLRQAIDAYLCLCQGEMARVDGRSDPDVWADAAQRWLALSQPYPSAYARWREGEALLAERSRSSRAAASLRAAYQAAVRLGAAPMRREVEALAQRARLRLDLHSDVEVEPRADRQAARAAARARYALSGRECEVWMLLPEGLTNNQIGLRLFISGKTASVHVTNILRKLGVRTRVQAITLAHQLDLVEPTSQPVISDE